MRPSNDSKLFTLSREQITPTYVANQMTQIDWLHFLTLWEELTESQKRVAEAVGVEERFLIRAMKGTVSTGAPRQMRQLAIHRRFYTALALHDLMNEVRLADVASTYKLNKGSLQSLQQQTATFAGMVTVFCHRLGWNTLYVLLEHFQSRLQFGVQLELCDLMRLPSMDSQSARLLYNAGLTNVASVATASAENVEVLLKNARPFEEKLDESVADGRTLVAEARKLLQLELGVRIQWTQNTGKTSPEKNLTKVTLILIIFEDIVKLPNKEDSVAPGNVSLRKDSQKVLTPVLAGNAHLLSPAENSARLSGSQSKRISASFVGASPLLLPAPNAKNAGIRKGSVSRQSLQPQQKVTTPLAEAVTTPLSRPSGGRDKNTSKENKKPLADVTPDMFQESSINSSVASLRPSPLSKAVESLRLSDNSSAENESIDVGVDTMRTPCFAACAEKLAPLTEQRPPSAKCLKRRVSVELSFILEATPPGVQQNSTRRLRKKTKLSTSPPVAAASASSASGSLSSDDSSIIPSTAPPATQLEVDEVNSQSKLVTLVRELGRCDSDVVAVHIYKEKNSVLGLAVAWLSERVSYVHLRAHFDSPLDQRRLTTIQSWLESLSSAKKKDLIIHDIRSVTKDLRSILPAKVVNALPLRDVDLCHWILEPSNTSTTLQKLAKMCSQSGSPFKAHRGRDKVLHECRSLLEIHHYLRQRLMEEKLWRPFVDVEMPVVSIMLRMEEVGMAFDKAGCESTLQVLRQHLKQLEETAHRLAGRPFSLTSTKETAKIIAKDLNLCEEVNRPPSSFINPLKKKYQPPSVSKASLIKLGRIHPLPRIVVEYRKICAIIQTILCPLLQASTFYLDGQERIAGECEFRHVTGRVNIVQPNLQHIPRPFSLSDGRAINIRTSFRSIPGTISILKKYFYR